MEATSRSPELRLETQRPPAAEVGERRLRVFGCVKTAYRTKHDLRGGRHWHLSARERSDRYVSTVGAAKLRAGLGALCPDRREQRFATHEINDAGP
jgi:hypothetical protein